MTFRSIGPVSGIGAARIRLVVLYGGESAEHDVSCVSAANVLGAVDPSRYEVVPVGITRTGQWMLNEQAAEMIAAGATALPDHVDTTGRSIDPLPVLASPTPGQPTVVLPLVHGPHGEDGTLQGMLELAGVPYVGSGVLGSAACMDKTMAKTLTAAAGIAQATALEILPVHDDLADLARHVLTLMDAAAITFPVFVKPANMGSSVGITKVHDDDGLTGALELGFGYDERLVLEEAIVGREIEVGVIGNTIGSKAPRASVPGEIVAGAEFYDYTDKYTEDSAQLLIPAPLSEAEADEARSLALDAYRALRCDGMARVDFFYEEDGRGFLLNEINTIPGFTTLSMFPKLWEASGVSYAELIDELVELALERHARRSTFRTDA